MKQLDLKHPAIKEMISRRSGVDPSYVAGVRAFILGGDEPPLGTIAFTGYLDAHDMSEYLSGVLADLRAEAVEEQMKISELRKSCHRDRISVHRTHPERSELVLPIKVKPSQGIRI